MERQILWSPVATPGLEHLHLTIAPAAIRVDSVVIALGEGGPFRLRYTLRCDGGWRVREVRAALLDDPVPPIVLRADGAGNWTTGHGQPLPELAGCVDVDITATPFTNTLPIRRLDWPIGAPRDLDMAYIWVPEMRVARDPQRYTRLGARLFRFESRDSDFTADLPIDADGLVVDYPGLFRRRWSA